VPVRQQNHATLFRIIFKECRINIKQSGRRKLLKIGISAEVYLLDNIIIRKLSRSEANEDTHPIVREATMYSILGDYPRIAECLSPREANFVNIKYYPHGDLAAFLLNKKGEITSSLQKIVVPTDH
jgi:hypothetical protein